MGDDLRHGRSVLSAHIMPKSDARRVAGVLGVNNHIRLASANAEQGATAGHRPLECATEALDTAISNPR